MDQKQRDRETERQRDRETERQRDRETERQRNIVTDMHIDKQKIFVADTKTKFLYYEKYNNIFMNTQLIIKRLT